jgi:hypothetical protein
MRLRRVKKCQVVRFRGSVPLQSTWPMILCCCKSLPLNSTHVYAYFGKVRLVMCTETWTAAVRPMYCWCSMKTSRVNLDYAFLQFSVFHQPMWPFGRGCIFQIFRCVWSRESVRAPTLQTRPRVHWPHHFRPVISYRRFLHHDWASRCKKKKISSKGWSPCAWPSYY